MPSSMDVDDTEREMKADDLTKSPTSSSGEDRQDEEKTEDNEKESRHKVSLLTYFKFIMEFINSFMVSATRYLNRFSRDYRYIRTVLAKEKKALKVL